MENNLTTRKIYIDTRYKRDLYGSNTNFEINLPQTVECPENCVMYVDEIVLPNTIATVQTGVNDKLYFGLFYNTTVKYRNITLAEQNYTIQTLTSQIKSLMNSQINTAEAEFNVTYNVDKLIISINVLDKRSTQPDIMRWQIFSDDNLKAGYYNLVPISNPTTCNELIQNNVVSTTAFWHDPVEIVSYNVDLHTTRNLYLLGDIGEYRTITNFSWSSGSVLKKIMMHVPYNDTLCSNVVMPYDCNHIGNQSFNRIRFRLVNSKGLEPNLKNNWSFSLIFAIQ